MAVPKDTKVVVIGGGIGGLALAIGLRRAGIGVEVYEKASDIKKVSIGGGLYLWNNGMRALKWLGIMDQVQAQGSRSIERFELRSWKDQNLVKWPIGDVAEQAGAPAMGVIRTVLHDILAGAVEEGVIRTSADCTSVEQDANGVTVRFADGQEARGAIAVAADGIRSTLRSKYCCETPIVYTGYTLWHGIAEYEHEVNTEGMFLEFWGEGARFILYPVTRTKIYWDAVRNAPQGGRDADGTVKKMLLEQFHDWPDPVCPVLESMPEAQIHRRDIYGSQPVKKWDNGRLTLLGDSAHPMTFNIGQGACQSLEDAVVLTKALMEESDPVAALRTYERKRMPRASEIVRRAWNIGQSGTWTNPVAIRVREIGMSASSKVAFKKHVSDMTHPF